MLRWILTAPWTGEGTNSDGDSLPTAVAAKALPAEESRPPFAELGGGLESDGGQRSAGWRELSPSLSRVGFGNPGLVDLNSRGATTRAWNFSAASSASSSGLLGRVYSREQRPVLTTLIKLRKEEEADGGLNNIKRGTRGFNSHLTASVFGVFPVVGFCLFVCIVVWTMNEWGAMDPAPDSRADET